MLSGGFEPAIPTIKRLQIYALGPTATGIGILSTHWMYYCNLDDDCLGLRHPGNISSMNLGREYAEIKHQHLIESGIPFVKFNYHIHKCPPLVPILSQLDSVHTPTSHFLKIRLNTSIIVPSTTGSPKWCLSLRFTHQTPVYASPLPHTLYLPRPSHSWFYHPNNIGWWLQIIKLLIM
jgi:hypothetical protein